MVVQDQFSRLPKHVAIIMDGNGRWAKARGLPRIQGHYEGVKRFDEIVTRSVKLGINVLTFYTFSLENWSRPAHEVSAIMKLLINMVIQKLDVMNKNGIRFFISGRRQGVPQEVLDVLDHAMESTRNNPGLVLNLAFNYGGRQELVDATRLIADDVVKGKLLLDAINEEVIGSRLYTAGLPDPDLLVRTSGEERISNFLLWQLSYTEFYFTNKNWPEFTIAEFDKALAEFAKRERRFGDVDVKKDPQ